jgi:hypothetical protein
VDVASSNDLIVAKVLLVTAAVAVSFTVNSAQAADDEIADPPAVVVPLIDVQVVLSNTVPITALPREVLPWSKYSAVSVIFH